MRAHKLQLAVVVRGLSLAAFSLSPASAEQSDAEKDWQGLEVTASAYTLAQDETKQGNKGLAAWGDELEPGMKVIAVSRDLIGKDLGHRARVKIEGLPGTYFVRDKMHSRWRNKIDILVPSKSQAMEWGKRKVNIKWLADGN